MRAIQLTSFTYLLFALRLGKRSSVHVSPETGAAGVEVATAAAAVFDVHRDEK